MLVSSELLIKIVPLAVAWYFVEMPLTIVDKTRAYSAAFFKKFSVLFLVRTALRPWKNIRQPYPDKGIQPKKILRAFSANMVARGVGAVIRLSTAALGTLVSAGVFGLGVIAFVFWLGAPLWAVISLWLIY